MTMLNIIENYNYKHRVLHVTQEIPFSESNEVIAKQMQILLTKIQAYRDKHYPQSAK